MGIGLVHGNWSGAWELVWGMGIGLGRGNWSGTPKRGRLAAWGWACRVQGCCLHGSVQLNRSCEERRRQETSRRWGWEWTAETAAGCPNGPGLSGMTVVHARTRAHSLLVDAVPS
eukprot:335935-Chlamydomonas_euryale.AAC.1